MKSNNCVQVNVEVDVDVFTSGTASRIVKTIVEYLIYHRSQIPLNFESFKLICDRLKEAQGKNDDEWSGCLKNKQKSEAILTLEQVQEMKNVRKSLYQKNKIEAINSIIPGNFGHVREKFKFNRSCHFAR